MPIPGVITSRRQYPRPKQKPQEHKPPKFFFKPPVKEGKEKRRRSRSRRRRRSPSVSSESPSQDAAEAALLKERKEEEEEAERKKQEEDEREREQLRKTAEMWAKAQQEREARQHEEARVAEENRQKQAQRDAARRQRLQGAFAVADELDEEEEDQGRAREFAAQRAKQLAQQRASSSDAPELDHHRGPLGMALAVRGEMPTDAVSLRAALADPSAARCFSPGEVAEKYKLLQEMKRKFRRPDFGGPPQKNRSRSRSRVRSSRKNRSSSRSRYDSVWIRPGST